MMWRALILALPMAAQAQDSWGTPDKREHFIISAMGGVVVQAVVENPHAAMAMSVMPGLLKELSDKRRGTGFSRKDLIADIAGAALGVYGGRWVAAHSDGYTVVAARWQF